MKSKSKKRQTVLTRKEARKNKRKEKKQRRNEYYTNRKKPANRGPQKQTDSKEPRKLNKVSEPSSPVKLNLDEVKSNSQFANEPSIDDLRRKEIQHKKKLESQMQSRRKKQMVEANRQEDVVIKHLEKQLKLNKRKSKGIPKSFAADGLDYLLEVCDSETRKGAAIAEKQLSGKNEDFEEDFFLMTGKPSRKDSNTKKDEESDDEHFEDDDFFLMSGKSPREDTKTKRFEESDDEDIEDDDFFVTPGKPTREDPKTKKDEESDDEHFEDDDFSYEQSEESDDVDNDDADSEGDQDGHSEVGSESASSPIKVNCDAKPASNNKINQLKRKQISDVQNDNVKRRKTVSFDKPSEDSDIENRIEKEDDSEDSIDDEFELDMENEDDIPDHTECTDEDIEDGTDESENEDNHNLEDEENDSSDKAENNSDNSGDSESDSEEVWEDIYGRKRRKDGTIVEKTKEQKYIPPAIRAKLASSDSKHAEKLNRLKKQLKGLLNRLAERNLYNISLQIENLYMNNSRFDMNNTITNLILEALVSPVNTPERLLMEHVVLVTVLHANVGTEVGAHFLQTVVKQFDTCIQENHEVENKTLDNLIKIIAQLYNFGLYDAKLLYEILNVLSEKFGEKEVECILHILRGVGFSLRKDNPLALKELIINLQKKAVSVPEEIRDNSRVKFMLDILLAIKNNNVNKIPNYDTSYSEHLKKIMKGFIRKGNYVSPLSITLQDLLKADENGKWWVVGSAWSGNALDEKVSLKSDPQKETFSQKLLDLAKKQRMNTDTRRSIFCIIMSAEDYIDAFEKLMRLSLKNQQQREIINVIIHCALQEKDYNPYYAVLAQKFCEHDRKYQMMVKYLVWDKLKALSDHSALQVSNLAKLLTHLFIEKTLPISALKIIQFSELDKLTVRFVRQVLLGILLHEDTDAVKAVFEKIWQAEKLKMFRDSLHLFICHFVLSNLKEGVVSDDRKELLETRAKMVEQILSAKREKFSF